MASAQERLNLRIREDDRDLFARAAESQRQSLTQFLAESGRERAERVLADRTGFIVNSEGWQELMAAMDRPARPNPGLADLLSRPENG